MALQQASPKEIYLGSTEVKAVYKGTVKVRPVTPTSEYTYDFMGKTISQVANDGWQNTSGWTIDSYGLYRNSWTPMYIPLPNTLSNASKITMRSTMRVKKGTGTLDVLYILDDATSINIPVGNYVGGVANDGSTVWYGKNNGTRSAYTHDYTGVTTWTFVVDLINKSATISYNDGVSTTPNSWTLTDEEVANVKSRQYIQLRQNGTYDRIQSIYLKVE